MQINNFSSYMSWFILCWVLHNSVDEAVEKLNARGIDMLRLIYHVSNAHTKKEETVQVKVRKLKHSNHLAETFVFSKLCDLRWVSTTTTYCYIFSIFLEISGQSAAELLGNRCRCGQCSCNS